MLSIRRQLRGGWCSPSRADVVKGALDLVDAVFLVDDTVFLGKSDENEVAGGSKGFSRFVEAVDSSFEESVDAVDFDFDISDGEGVVRELFSDLLEVVGMFSECVEYELDGSEVVWEVVHIDSALVLFLICFQCCLGMRKCGLGFPCIVC